MFSSLLQGGMTVGGNATISVGIVGQQPRGHLSDFMANPPEGVEYRCLTRTIPSDVIAGRPAMSRSSWPSRLVRSRIVTALGVFLPVFGTTQAADVILSVNRFYAGSGQAVVWLERPAAPLHYRPTVLANPITRRIVRTLVEREDTWYVCWSQACQEEFTELFGRWRPTSRVIGPVVAPPPDLTALEKVRSRQDESRVRFLFVGSQFHLKGGKELVTAFEDVYNHDKDVMLTLVTDPERVGSEWLRVICKIPAIQIVPATLSRQAMWRLMDLHQVLVHPTLFDSFALIVLESMSLGLPVITTAVYALPELAEGAGALLLRAHTVSPFELGYDPIRSVALDRLRVDLTEELAAAMRDILKPSARMQMALQNVKRGKERHAATISQWGSLFHALARSL